jgi:hypothetical protein
MDNWIGKEKRRFPRSNFPCKIIIYLPHKHTIISNTENIGIGGSRVIIEEALAVGSVVGMVIFINPYKQIKCKAKVVWQIESKNVPVNNLTLFDTGLEFMDMSKVGKEAVEELLETLSKKDDAG